jgi:hypothetical protein
MKIKRILHAAMWLIAVFALAGGALPAFAEAEGGQPFDVRFTGVIVTVGGAGEPWTIGPQTVATDANTRIVFNGPPARPGEPGGGNPPTQTATPGQWAEVDAQRQADGSLLAKLIHVRPETVQLRGIVSDMPTAADGVGVWTIAGVAVQVTADTRIGARGESIAVGNWVEAVMTEDGGALTAVRILKVEERDEVEVTGAIQSFATDKWVLSAIMVTLNISTTVVGDPAVGLIAHAAARLQDDGSLLAERVRVKWDEKQKPATPVRFEGVIETLPAAGLRGEWVISGKTVEVPAMARINQEKGLAVVGAKVSVLAIPKDDKLTAIEITVLASPQAGGRRVVFVGRIEALPASGIVGIWKIGGKDVAVTAQTTLLPKEFTPKVGAWVLVEGVRSETAPIVASLIRLQPAGPRPGFDPAESPELATQ